MTKRQQYTREMIFSMFVGNLITVILLAGLHKELSPGELIVFWLGTWNIATYCIWSVIDWVDRIKHRDAWQSNPGKVNKH